MKIYGFDIDSAELKRRVGRMSQVMGAREIEFRGGMQHGVKAVEMYNDTGLSFVVMLDKGMDIADAFYCGKSITWQCKNGIVSPSFFENSSSGFFRGFAGGLVGTCGYTHTGTPCEEDGVFLGLHDRADNLPAERCAIEEGFVDGVYTVKLTGYIRQSCLYHENILVKREITIKQGEPRLWLRDTVTNDGYNPTPFMLMYHINFGWPVVSEHSGIWSPAVKLLPEAGGERENARPIAIDAPIPGYTYECCAHEMPAGADSAAVAVFNEALQFGAYVRYCPDELPVFNTWRMTGEQDYVFSVEPGTNVPEGRASARQNGRLTILQPLEQRVFHLELGVVADEKAAREFKG